MKTKEAIKKRFCINCRFGSFLNKDEPCRNCVFVPSQFLSKEEITDVDIPMGKKDRKELIAYRKMWEEFCLSEGDLVKVVNYVKNRYKQKYFPGGK